MESTKRITIVLDQRTRLLLACMAGKTRRGLYIRDSVAALVQALKLGAQVQPVPIQGRVSNFPLKAPQALLEDADVYRQEKGFSTLSAFIRTAVAISAGEGEWRCSGCGGELDPDSLITDDAYCVILDPDPQICGRYSWTPIKGRD
jgi:hypothetical protein